MAAGGGALAVNTVIDTAVMALQLPLNGMTVVILQKYSWSKCWASTEARHLLVRCPITGTYPEKWTHFFFYYLNNGN